MSLGAVERRVRSLVEELLKGRERDRTIGRDAMRAEELRGLLERQLFLCVCDRASERPSEVAQDSEYSRTNCSVSRNDWKSARRMAAGEPERYELYTRSISSRARSIRTSVTNSSRSSLPLRLASTSAKHFLTYLRGGLTFICTRSLMTSSVLKLSPGTAIQWRRMKLRARERAP